MSMLKNKFFFSMASAAVVLSSMAHAEDKNAAAVNKAPAQEQQELSQEDIKKVSEAFGHFIGRNLSAPGVKLDLDSIIKGLRDGAAGKPAPMSDKDYEAMMMKLQETAYKRTSSDNLKAANDFMEKNAKEPGIVVVEPGKLQYTILQPGNGAVVAEHNSPSIQYTGKYIDGTVFGSSTDAGGPITVPLDQTIPGFSKGIVGMKEGEKRKLFVHPDLGYGTTGHLSPNALLIFEVEVIKANAPESETTSKSASAWDGDEEDDDIGDIDDEMDDMDLDDSQADNYDYQQK